MIFAISLCAVPAYTLQMFNAINPSSNRKKASPNDFS